MPGKCNLCDNNERFVMQFPIANVKMCFCVHSLLVSQAERGIFIALPHLRAALANPDANRRADCIAYT
jgi:DNA-binding cell septation regulator SpoVG